MALFKLRIEAADADAGRTAAGRLGELVAPEALAVTLFEARPPRFTVEAYWDTRPPMAMLARTLADVVGLGTPALEAVPDLNWVALSQAALPPIEAGRLLVHGSHDRARFALRQTAIEIDAGEAFGTGHNPTTAGCLLALDALNSAPALPPRPRPGLRHGGARHCRSAAAGRCPNIRGGQ